MSNIRWSKKARRKAKVYAVDMAMVFAAVCMTTCIKAEPKRSKLNVNNRVHASVESTETSFTKETTLCANETEEYTTLIESRDWDSEDAEVLLKIAMAEAEGEGTEGKALVMLVVLNRAWSDGFPDSIEDVVFQEGQFSTTTEGGRYWTTEPDEDCYNALNMIECGWDESQGALYFESADEETWHSRNCEFLFRYKNHRFYK